MVTGEAKGLEMRIRNTKCPNSHLMGVKPEVSTQPNLSQSQWHFRSWNKGPESMSGTRWSEENSAECLVSGSAFCLVGVYAAFRAGKQFLAGVANSRPWDNWLTLGMNAACRGEQIPSIELEIEEGFFRPNWGNWQESRTQEPDLQGSSQNRSLGTSLGVKPCYLRVGGRLGSGY